MPARLRSQGLQSKRRRRLMRRIPDKVTYTGNIYRYRQIVNHGVFENSNNLTPSAIAYKFMLSYLPQANQFEALYDQYKIDKVVLKFTPRGTLTTSSGGSVANGIYWYSVIDYDDSALPVSLDLMREYEKCRVHSFNGGIQSVTVKPHVAMAAYGSGAFTSYANKGNQWIDCASPSVEHYGVKVMFPPADANTYGLRYDVHGEYYLSFKSVH